MKYKYTTLVATLMLAGTSFAETINVPGDHATIQDAIYASSNGDVNNIAPDTYYESDLSTSLLTQLVVAELEVKSKPLNGLAGIGQPKKHVHGKNCVSAKDRENMSLGLREYIRKFGPLSQASFTEDNRKYPIFPVGAREWEDLIMVNYVDMNPDEGSHEAWDCGSYSYDGHKGIDGLIYTFEHQFVGVPIIAPFDGVVYLTHDGEPDQNTVWDPDTASNYVAIDHGLGRYIWYLHMKQGSVSVEVGEEVKAGQQIGMVASSGYSDWPHLHFESWIPHEILEDEWVNYEPYAGDCNLQESGWINQIPIPVGATCKEFGVTTTDLNDFFADEEYMWMPPLEGYIPIENDGVWMWTIATDIGPFSNYQMRFYDPNGNLQHDSGTNWLNFSWTSYKFLVTWFYWDFSELAEIPGTWTVDVLVNGDPYINFPMTLVEEGDPTPNRTPEPIEAIMTPYFPTVDDLLSCQILQPGPVNDLDWDLVRYEYTWSVGGNVLRQVETAGLADHLPRLDACPGAIVTCTVVPTDGQSNGEPFTVSKRIEGNSDGDINCDGNIDVNDLLKLIADWGSCEQCAGDLNQSGEVNIADLLTLLANWS